MNIKPLIAFILPLVTLAPTASAALIVGYSFPTPSYTAGSNLNGQNGWSGSNFIQVNATGLENAGMLGETGGSIRGLSSFANAGQGIVTSPITGSDSPLGTGTQYWFAALVSMNDFTTDANYVRLRFDADVSTGFSFGLLNNTFVANGDATGFSGTQYTAGTTALIVGRMTVTSTGGATNEVFDFWFNPTDATSAATLTSSAQGTILGKGINAIFGNDWGSVTASTDMTGSANNNWYQDEIRVGTALSDLNLATAVVPEPSTAALLGGGLALLLLRRRRSRCS